MNEDDKKFIKETIENAVQNKMSAYEQKTEAREKINNLKREEQSKKDKQEYIAMLKKRDEQGQATLAQKMELFKSSITDAIPDPLKQAGTTAKQFAGKSIQNGANQIGSGLSTINRKIMMSNPLTAMLYQNRELFGAVGDIGMGGLKMGWGAAKGVAGGVAGLLNASVNMFKKKKQTEEETPEEETTKKPSLFSFGKKDSTAKIAEEKEKWKDQINDIHRATFALNKENKKFNLSLFKGLGGLGDAMKSIKGVTDMIGNKQKLILFGVLAGVAAIAALAAWFQDGNFAKLIKDAVKSAVNAALHPDDSVVHTPPSSKIDDANLTDTSGQQIQDLDPEQTLKQYDNYKTGITGAEKIMGSSTKQFVNNLMGRGDTPVAISYKGGAGEPYLLIKDAVFLNKQPNKTIKEEWDLEFHVPNTTGNFYAMNVVNPIVIKDKQYKRGEQIGWIGKNGRMNYRATGDVDQDFITLYNQARDNGFKDQKAQIQKALSEKGKAEIKKQYDKEAKQQERDAAIIDHSMTQPFNKNREQEHAEYLEKKQQRDDAKKQQKQTPTVTKTEQNKNSDKTKQQQEQIKKQEEEKKKQQQKQQDTKKKSDAGTLQNNTIAMMPQNTPGSPTFADIGMNLSEHGTSSGNTGDLSSIG